jgi:hypothetical protein
MSTCSLVRDITDAFVVKRLENIRGAHITRKPRYRKKRRGFPQEHILVLLRLNRSFLTRTGDHCTVSARFEKFAAVIFHICDIFHTKTLQSAQLSRIVFDGHNKEIFRDATTVPRTIVKAR